MGLYKMNSFNSDINLVVGIFRQQLTADIDGLLVLSSPIKAQSEKHRIHFYAK